MSPSNNNRRSGRATGTPQRVTNAVDQMYNTAAHGNLRGFVPQQTGAQPPLRSGATQQTGAWQNTGRIGAQQTGMGQNTGRIDTQQTGSRPVMGPGPMQTGAQPVYHAVPQGGGQRGFGTPTAVEKPKKKRKAWLAMLIAVLAVGLITGGILYGIQLSKEVAEKQRISDKVTPYNDLFCPGVYVDGIHLSGMTPEQAKNSVQSQIDQRHDAWSVQLTYNGTLAATVDANLLNMNVDQNELNAVLNEAWKQGHTGTEAERYDQMEALERTPYQAYTVKPSGDTSRIDTLLESLKQQIDQPAEDAQVLTFDTTRAYPFLFKEEVTGLRLDIEPLKEQLYQMVSTMTNGTLELKPETVQPNQTVAELEKHYALRAMATTPIDKHSTEERNNNIRRCFQLISGTVVQPGKTFSFNKTVGPRTFENGFYPAIEYINDEHVEGIGGGACQASTTVYQAAVCSGMEIVSRRPHSDSVSYAEYGMDATVYMGGKQIDLQFKNTTEEPIYITAEVLTDPTNKSRLMTKVCFYGADLGNVRYTLETQTIETLPSIMAPVYVSDKESEQDAKDGCIVDSYRMTYTDGVLTNREFLFKDTYNPKPQKIYDPNAS